MQTCSRCIMNSSVPQIRFDERGECNYCKLHDELDKENPKGEEGKKRLAALVDQIKEEGKGKKYDCIVGVSGGTDSTYTLLMAKKLGLRPLAVTYDNHWGTKISDDNIKNATKKLGVELCTFSEDWGEFRDLELAFFRASTPDIEVISDERIKQALHKAALENGIRYILNGHCFRVEGKIPPLWSYADSKYINSVQKRFGTRKLKKIKFPGLFNTFMSNVSDKVKTIRLLDYLDYSKEDAKKVLTAELGWQDYGGHHYESVITRYCYGYLLPTKFGIDKRITHLSANVRSGFITREAALRELATPPMTEREVKEDEAIIVKKLGLTEKEFRELIARKPKSFMDYPNHYRMVYRFRRPLGFIYKRFLGRVPYTLTMMEHTENE